MLEGIKAVIFDLDGTLVDSMWMWKAIDIEYLAGYGYELPEDLQPSIEGMSFSETAVYFKERFKIPEDVETIKQEWNRMAIDIYRHRVGFKPGARAFLDRLRNHGIKTGIASSNSIELVDTVMEALKIRNLFDEVHVSCEVKRGKPFPDIFLLVAERLGVKPSECLVFEDIIPGIEAARAAGMKVCAIYDDFSKDETKAKTDAADYYIESYDEVTS